MTDFVRFLRDESGATAAEYALLLAVIGSGIAVGALFLGDTIGNSMNNQAETIRTCGDGTCS